MHTRIDYCNGLLVPCPHDLTDRGGSPRGCQAGTAATVPIICVGSHASTVVLVGCHCGLMLSASVWDGTGCEFDSWQCRIYIPCSLILRLLNGSFQVLWLDIKIVLKRRPGELQDRPPCLQMSPLPSSRLPIRSVHSGFNFSRPCQHALNLEVGPTTVRPSNQNKDTGRVLLYASSAL